MTAATATRPPAAQLVPELRPVIRVHIVGTVHGAAVCTGPSGRPELVVTLEPAGGGDVITASVPCGPRVIDLHDLAHRLPRGAGAILIGGGLAAVWQPGSQTARIHLLDCDAVAPCPLVAYPTARAAA